MKILMYMIILISFMMLLLNQNKIIYLFISLELLNFLLVTFILNYNLLISIYMMLMIQICESLIMLLLLLKIFSNYSKEMYTYSMM